MVDAGNLGAILRTCCAAGGKCAPTTTYWETPTWIALSFGAPDPHCYHYAYTVEGNPGLGDSVPVDGSNRYWGIAYGDLDCDGVYSTFTAYGEINSVYADGPAGASAVARIKPLE